MKKKEYENEEIESAKRERAEDAGWKKCLIMW